MQSRLARKLLADLESPIETLLRLAWQESHYVACLKVCLDLGIFDILDENLTFVSVDKLTQHAHGDPALLVRILCHIAAMGGLREDENGNYASTSLSIVLQRMEMSAAIDFSITTGWPLFCHMPAFQAKIGYKDPVALSDCCWFNAKNIKLPHFESLNENPKDLEMFANHMAGSAEGRSNWLNLYPIDKILSGADADGALVVDIGGSRSHDVEQFRVRAPQEPGRLIIQDLPLVIEEAKRTAHKSVRLMAHDFTQPQPIRCKYICIRFRDQGTELQS